MVSRAPQIQGFNFILAKRIFDLTVCIFFLPIVVFVLLLIALVILVDSGRPIFFIQERVGKGGRKFRIYKFRTLCHDYSDVTHREWMKAYVRGADNRGPGAGAKQLFKPFDQKQMTRVGKLLRKTSMDELPQTVECLAR